MSRFTSRNNRTFIIEFIEVYKKIPALWDVNSPGYIDRISKQSGYLELINKLREVQPHAGKKDVVRRINSLRGAFRRQHLRVCQMTSAGKKYKPTLWYYNLLTFLADKDESSSIQECETNLSDCEEVNITKVISLENSLDNIHENSLQEEDDDDKFIEEFNIDSNISIQFNPSQTITLHKGEDENSANSSGTDGRNISSLESSLDIHENSCKEEDDDEFTEDFNIESNSSITSKPHTDDQIKPLHKWQDEHDAVSYNIASKLRNMEKNQRIIAERIIAETLFQGQLGTLTIKSSCSKFHPTVPVLGSDDEDVNLIPTASL